MFVRTSTETVLLRAFLRRTVSTHPSVFFFPFLSERKIKNKKNPQSWRRREEAIEGKEDAAMKGPSGPIALFPLRGACYWCKMALCLSETPAS